MDKSTLVFTWHAKAEVYYCMCGEKFGHNCEFGKSFDKISFVKCNSDICNICKESRYDEQWVYDRDGYTRCLLCDDKCEIDRLPKDCECFTYIDVEGISRCKQCETLREEYQENVCICDEEIPISQWNTYVAEDDVSKCKVCDMPRQESQENVCECDVVKMLID